MSRPGTRRMRGTQRTRRVVLLVLAATGCVLGVAPSATAHDRTAVSEPAASEVRFVPASAEATAAHAASAVAAMTSREKAATVVMGHTPSTDPTVLADYMARTGAGGFILMGANIPGDAAALRTLTASLAVDPALPPLVAVDQEGGDVSRLRWDDFPSSLTLKSEAPDATKLAFSGRGALVEAAGIGVNFGIVADWTDDRGSFIYRRVLGTTPQDAADRVSAAVRGEAPFAASTLKHFPGHGAAPGDSHRVIPETSLTLDQWRAAEALPFQSGIDAGAQLVMFGHLAYTAVDSAPASLSASWHQILRDELGFTGVAVTDDMAMLEASGMRDPVENAILAVIAGNDLILGVGYSSVDRANAVIDGIAGAIGSGRIPAERIDEAAARVIALRLTTSVGAVPCAECTPAG